MSLLMAVAMAALCAGAWRDGGLPRVLAGSGLGVAAALAGLSSPVFGGPSPVPVALAVSGLSLWMLAVGVWCWRARDAGPRPAPPSRDARPARGLAGGGA